MKTSKRPKRNRTLSNNLKEERRNLARQKAIAEMRLWPVIHPNDFKIRF